MTKSYNGHNELVNAKLVSVWIDWLGVESGLSGVATMDVEGDVAAIVTLPLNHRWMSGEEKHLVTSDDRSPDCLN